VRLRHFAVLDDEGVAFAARLAEDGGAVEGEVEGGGEGFCWEEDCLLLT